MTANTSSILALDVGTVRIGVAISDSIARLPRPMMTLVNNEDFTEQLRQIIDNEGVTTLIVGLPRSLNGEDTDQTRLVRRFVANWQADVGLPLFFQDEALSSARAKEELRARGKLYQKGDIDALAATYILDDYLANNPTGSGA